MDCRLLLAEVVRQQSNPVLGRLLRDGETAEVNLVQGLLFWCLSVHLGHVSGRHLHGPSVTVRPSIEVFEDRVLERTLRVPAVKDSPAIVLVPLAEARILVKLAQYLVQRGYRVIVLQVLKLLLYTHRGRLRFRDRCPESRTVLTVFIV